MNWEQWIADGSRDLVLLAAGGGIAWLSGLSASRRTEKFEREKREEEAAARAEERERADVRMRDEATQRECRNALSVVFEIERAISDTHPKSWDDEADIPRPLISRLVSIGALIPDETARDCIDRFVNLVDAWRLLTEWGHDTSTLETTPIKYQSRMLYRLRKVLSAEARGDGPATQEAVELESFDVMRAAALDAYWAQQAEDEMRFRTGRS